MTILAVVALVAATVSNVGFYFAQRRRDALEAKLHRCPIHGCAKAATHTLRFIAQKGTRLGEVKITLCIFHTVDFDTSGTVLPYRTGWDPDPSR